MRSHRSNLLTNLRSLLVVVALLICGVHGHAQGYTNVAAQQGLDFTVPIPFPDFGTGVCFFDFDGDGWDDLSFGNVDGDLKFYRNVQGTLQAMPEIVQSTGKNSQILWGDIDNDGDPDLLVTTFQGPVRLFRNDGNWDFVNVTASSGLVQEAGNRWGASFGDLDKDGFLDLYVCTYIYQPEEYAYSKLNHLYRNNGDGTFTDVTLPAGVGNGLKASFQSTWVDFNEDGWPDIYVINDFADANALFRNNGNGTFTDMALAMGLDETGEHCMSISLSDFDLDGDLDLYITNTGIFPQTNNARHMLMVNDGSGNFMESSTMYGLDIFEWGWGSLWVDHDNDGFDDLYIATHRMFEALGVSGEVPNLFFKNEGGSGFQERADLFPDSMIASSHAIARGDLNGDGYSDIVVQNQEPYPPMLWVNEGGPASYVRIGVEGVVSNRQAVGTWIRVFAGGGVHTQYTVCGENYIGQSSQYIIFGLGGATVIDSVEVEYSSGHVDRYYDLEVDRTYRFTEGETIEVEISALGPVEVCTPDSIVLDAGEHAYYQWSTGDTIRTIVVHESGSYSVTAGDIPGLTATSTPVWVTVSEQPVIYAVVNHPHCAGGSNGSIQLANLIDNELSTVVWEPTGEGGSLAGLSAGVYSYTVEDVNGCTYSGTVELMDPEPLFVLCDAMPEVQGNDGAITWTIFGGTPPYFVTLNGETGTGSGVDSLASGTYQVLVTDSLGCQFLNDVVVSSTVGVASQKQPALRVYPNPTAHRLYVDTPARVVSYKVFDSMGRCVIQGKNPDNIRDVSVRSLSAGTYVLQMRTSDGERLRARFQKAPANSQRR
jgi:hypothetical protein